MKPIPPHMRGYCAVIDTAVLYGWTCHLCLAKQGFRLELRDGRKVLAAAESRLKAPACWRDLADEVTAELERLNLV